MIFWLSLSPFEDKRVSMPPKRRLIFIVNPISGTHNKQSVLSLLPRHLDAEKFDWSVVKTEYPGHAAKIAREAARDNVDVVVAIGGDGTVNEVARSLTHTQTALGIIPCGSGNGLARHLQIPMDPLGAINLLNEGEVQVLDYGLINQIPFFCTCGVGFDAFVSSKFAHSERRGMLTYLENTLREGLKYEPDTYEIEVDGDKRQTYKAFLIACANASQYGNNVYIAPAASMSDGLMDVTIMEPFTMLEAPQIAIQLFTKNITKNSRIKTIRCKKLRINREIPGVIHYDGDPVMTGKNIEVELIEKGLRVVVRDVNSTSAGPLLRTFSDFYNELSTIGEELLHGNRTILSLNKELLRKLRSK